MSDPDDRAPVRLARTVLYESPWVNLYRDRVALPTGRILEQYHFLDLGRAVVVIVQDREQRILLERVARYPTGTTTWELPAGGIEPEETALEAARREVFEETGYETANHEEIYVYHPLNGISNQVVSVVACQAGDWCLPLRPRSTRPLRSLTPRCWLRSRPAGPPFTSTGPRTATCTSARSSRHCW